MWESQNDTSHPHDSNARRHRQSLQASKRQRIARSPLDDLENGVGLYESMCHDDNSCGSTGNDFAHVIPPACHDKNPHSIIRNYPNDSGRDGDSFVGADDENSDSIIAKIEAFLLDTFLDQLVSDGTTEVPAVPRIDTDERKLSLENIHQCRNLTSILLVASFCHRLLLAGRTTTTREVYYYYVTHFHHQRECEKAIWDLTILLGLSSRLLLGLTSSPKGWFCGSITLYHEQSGDKFLDGRELDTHGTAITPTTYGDSSNVVLANNQWRRALQQDSGRQLSRRLRMESDAKCIVVIEKEGAYTRLSEDRVFDKIPCILVTGKGFPDVATRQWVHHLHNLLQIPVVGLCDCNPYGISVLNTYQYQHGVQVERAKQQKDQREESNDSTRNDPTLHLQWIGLRPSQIETLDLPKSIFQALTELDKKRLKSLLQEDHPFAQQGLNPKQRRKELLAMKEYKVELEALHWMGMAYLSEFVLSSIQGMLDGCRDSII